MYYPDEIIEEVRLQSDVVDIIGSYVHLQRKGSSHFGLCPFHNEKTPSFSVSKDKQIYYCFGCGAGGNVFSFVMAYENYNFVEAVKYLASKANIELPEPEVSAEVKAAMNYKQRLYDANKEAAKYFYVMLRGENGKIANTYFERREVTKDIMKQFGLGYAPQSRNDLYNYLIKKGFSNKEIFDCGLVYEDKNKKDVFGNRFFNRVMFPIFDIHNRVIAFGGRVLGDGEPKYLNSPETVLFDKSRNLYGLNIARKSRENYMILVEGYMDVIALHQNGFDNAIASLGTAFTGGHGHLIKRYVDEVVISFDSDGAGVNATLRAIPILKSAGLIVRVLVMNEYKDPDEYIKAKGSDNFKELIKKAIPSFMFEIVQLSKQYDLSDPEYKTRFSEEVAKKLLSIEGKLERDNYLEAITKNYYISKEGLEELLGKFGKNIGIVHKNDGNFEHNRDEKRLKQGVDAVTIAQKEFLAIIVSHKQIFHLVKTLVTPEYFTHETLQKVGLIVYDLYEKGKSIEPAYIMSKFTQIDDQKLIAGIFGEEIKIENQLQLEKLLNDTIRNIKNEYLDKKQKITTDPIGLMELIKEKKELLRLYVRLEDIDRRD